MQFSFLSAVALLIQVSTAWTLPQFILADPEKPTCECNFGTDGAEYICGDSRLGPVNLPKELILGTVMSRYDRFGTLTPIGFINQWWNVSENEGKGGWDYPKQGGFLLDERGNPVKTNMTLAVGTLVDRFGGESGRYLTLAATPFSQRSLAPNSLNTHNGNFTYGYHVYNVTKEFVVEAGPIAPAFGQPGLGTQFWTGGPGLNLPVSELCGQGYLDVIASTQLDIVKTGCGQ
ncbi:hypothetical protein LB507_010797 [Fusarium sp. FIESC RH6]|nr:hypothetical protein LB507_010797 [Fusarium sp. FIESC RH6]